MSLITNHLEELAKDLLSLSKKIRKGKKGIDFCIESETDGIDHYEYTPLESGFEERTKKLFEILNNNPESLSLKVYEIIKKAFDNASVARDSFRGRTPSFGGDWQDIESLVLSESSYTAYKLKEIARKLKQNSHPEFKHVSDETIAKMY